MKIIYNDSKIEKEIKECADKLSANTELRKTIKEGIEEFKKKNKGVAIGCPVPEAFIDLGEYLFSFFSIALVSGATYDLVKEYLKKLLLTCREKTSKKYNHFLISNGEDPKEFLKNIYFFIPIEIDEEELDSVLDKIKKATQKIEELKEEVKIEGSPRLYYENGELILRKIESEELL